MGGNSAVEIQPREGTKRRRFKPWMNWRRMFQRKGGNVQQASDEPAPASSLASASASSTAPKGHSSRPARLAGVFNLTGPSRSRSIGELLSSPTSEPQPIPLRAEESGGEGFLGAGLSVSHDSVFGLEASPCDSYANRQQRIHESLPSSASLQYMSELRAAIGRRRSTDEDEGFPRSPLNISPTTVNASLHHTPVHAGSGSDPSLLSINSCEFEEASFPSLHGRTIGQPSPQQPQQLHKRTDSGTADASLAHGVRADEDGLPGVPAAPLNHSAARHKMAIRPKRNHAPARVRQLPQLAEDSGIGDDMADWTSSPSADERDTKRQRQQQQQHIKPRSLSLSRTEDSAIKEAPVQGKPSAGSSTTKLARSKSSVEKKIQHEVAVFWRKTKEGRLFQRKESNATAAAAAATADRHPAQESGPAADTSEPEIKRKDLRKIKRDKEEKRKRSEAGKDEPSPPFLSRIFGSRRSGRRLGKKPHKEEAPPVPALTAQVEPAQPTPKPRTVFLPPNERTNHDGNDDDDEMEVDWRVPHQPYSFAPPPSKVLPPVRQPEEWVEEDQLPSSLPAPSPRPATRSEELRTSPLPPRHRIHIAGLSPYQRRVARIGNGLEISDEEWDDSTSSPIRRYQPDSVNHSNISLEAENSSLPVNINHDFILKKAAGAPELGVPESIRRSLDILKFSNEGLKKTIDSLNNQRMSQSSDQLHLSDDNVRRAESTGSVSNSTSSLNISDADLADIDGSAISLDHSSAYEKDVRDDVLIVDDHKETIEATVWPTLSPSDKADSSTDKSEPSPGVKSGPNSVDSKSGSNSPALINAPSSQQQQPEFLHIQLNPVQDDPAKLDALDDVRQKTPAKTWETPMFSMSVRVQNPPDAKFRRSSSASNAEAQQPGPEASASNETPKPFIACMRTRTEDDAATHQLMARLSARPWQSKEDKERQNKVLLDRSQSEAVATVATAAAASGDGNPGNELEIPPEVKLRVKKPSAVEETSELLKVFARRSLKLRDSRDFTDAEPDAVVAAATTPPEPACGSIFNADVPAPSEMRNDPPIPKERVSNRWVQSKPPVAVRTDPPERMPKRPSKSVPLVRGLNHDDNAEQRHSTNKPEDEKPASSPGSKNPSPTGGVAAAKFLDARPEVADDVWKKQQPLKSRYDRFSQPSQPLKPSIEEVKTPPVPAVRQSKVLDMVHNFQRLQVT